jgi:hypothetical protein
MCSCVPSRTAVDAARREQRCAVVVSRGVFIVFSARFLVLSSVCSADSTNLHEVQGYYLRATLHALLVHRRDRRGV